VEALPERGIALGDRKNLAFSSTAVTYGRGRAVVIATGQQTEVGTISALLSTVTPAKTPLEAHLDRVGRWLAHAALVVVALVVTLGLLRGLPVMQMVIFSIALAVAVVSEALPAVVTISLALGAQRMVQRNALVRRLPTVETLGSTTVICSDKTGTLTMGEMTVRELFVERKSMVTLHGRGPCTAYAKGAPEVILAACTRLRTAAGEASLSPETRAQILGAAQSMAQRALRVLAIARRRPATLGTAACEMTFLGLIGMLDAPRPEAHAAI